MKRTLTEETAPLSQLPMLIAWGFVPWRKSLTHHCYEHMNSSTRYLYESYRNARASAFLAGCKHEVRLVGDEPERTVCQACGAHLAGEPRDIGGDTVAARAKHVARLLCEQYPAGVVSTPFRFEDFDVER